MYVQVKLLEGFSQDLLYKIPENWQKKPDLGSIVSVPLRNSVRLAFVKEILNDASSFKFQIKELIKLEEFPDDSNYINFLENLSFLYQTDVVKFIQRISKFIKEDSKKSDLNFVDSESLNVNLTKDQQSVVDYLKESIEVGKYCPTLLHGVTGSGKTEVYKKIIEICFVQNKTSILLLPEVTLAIQFESILKNYFGSKIKIFGFHSSSLAIEKRAMWKSLLNKEPILIIGVHLPILLPISNLGAIIIDEEHEKGYQEKKHPRINSKEAAILKASLNKIPILLGSATPSFSSLYNVENKDWKFFQLKERFSGKLPNLQIVELAKSRKRPNFWISYELQEAIKDRLLKKEQIIIFINRRGYSFFVQCKNCGFVVQCKNCSISLTLHENDILKCHYCGNCEKLSDSCKNCKSSDNPFIKKGVGTQQAVSILKSIFPNASIERADMDATIKKEKWKQTIKNFEDGKIDILVGTQTLTKGYHFPNVTLVGVLWADLNLSFPSYNSSENCLQQLIQVAGRAGRGTKDSLVIVQIMNQIKLYEFLDEINYLKFYKHELKNRKLIGYPPYIRFAEIEIKNSNEEILQKDSDFIFEHLIEKISKSDFARMDSTGSSLCQGCDRQAPRAHVLNCQANSNSVRPELVEGYEPSLKNKYQNIDILGPVDSAVYKVKNFFSKKIYLKGSDLKNIIHLYESVDKRKIKSSIFFTPNPL